MGQCQSEVTAADVQEYLEARRQQQGQGQQGDFFHKIESGESSEFLNQTSLGCEIPGRKELADKLLEATKATTDKD